MSRQQGANPYAVPLAQLEAVRVVPEAQVTLQAAPRLEHLPGSPVLWSVGGVAAGGGPDGGGGGGGCDGGGDC